MPEAWAISNKEHEGIMKKFFEAIRSANKDENIYTDTFMSDMAPAFYNAWCQVFSKPSKHLACRWHVDRAWKNNVNRFIKHEGDKDKVYRMLKAVEEVTDRGQFHQLLGNLQSFLQDNHRGFCEYFNNNYVSNHKYHLWAACYRLGTLANTNMFAESFRGVLKTKYFNDKRIRRVGRLLSVLLSIAADKVLDEHQKSMKPDIYQMKQSRARHRNAEGMKDTKISQIGDSESWTLGEGAIVNLRKEQCECALQCQYCGACYCKFSCSCHDYLTKKALFVQTHAQTSDVFQQ